MAVKKVHGGLVAKCLGDESDVGVNCGTPTGDAAQVWEIPAVHEMGSEFASPKTYMPFASTTTSTIRGSR